jgi:hypothetical protein
MLLIFDGGSNFAARYTKYFPFLENAKGSKGRSGVRMKRRTFPNARKSFCYPGYRYFFEKLNTR